MTKQRKPRKKEESAPMEFGDEDSKDWETPCCVCAALPTVAGTDLCGPCCFGEADTVGGNW